MELLLFRLDDKQIFGINVFKVKEVVRCPQMSRIPRSHPIVRGVANMRGKTISIVDMAKAIGREPFTNPEECFVIIAEYNRSIQGFLVDSVDRIVNINWQEILPPPKGSGSVGYLTAVTKLDDQLIEVLDVEKILAEFTNMPDEVSEQTKDNCVLEELKEVKERKILVVDDSGVARNQIKRTLDQIEVKSVMAKNGSEALKFLRDLAKKGSVHDEIKLVISDVEMPEMDGYTLTSEIRKDPDLADLYVVLHTSLSGVFNQQMIDKVGADQFIAKFDADELASGVFEALHDSKVVRSGP